MNLAVNPPLLPMLAKRVDSIPSEGNWIYEPKWDGFRVLVFRDGDEVLLQSRDEKSLNRYFPEMLAPLREQLPDQCVLDGELVIANAGHLDFDALQLRIHPAASRVKLLAQQTPASCVFFDLLCNGKHDLRTSPFSKRRAELESLLKFAKAPIHITPATKDRSVATDWFKRFEGAGLDGVVAKPIDLPYQPDKRVMLKIKHERDCDCVVAGFRWYKEAAGKEIGSLLLGLYNDGEVLQHVGVCASFTAPMRRELLQFLAPYREDALRNHPWKDWESPEDSSSFGDHRMPGGKSRWSRGKDLEWEPIRPELVIEVAYEHMQSGRFRHMAHFRRWRTDRKPKSCTFAQLEVVAPEELKSIFKHG
ncbi:ATP-dependent DNA ligase [Occallatibacter savannae]|uniref:ATP-dependent DNA ligase n=1 Tax=Occallatibacter savannae TaxID=1002691 RepID=UPI000D68B1CE|nr:ATP-dependent DNA ligase [Occallatibacter savannae]